MVNRTKASLGVTAALAIAASITDANARESAAAAVLVAQASVASAWSPNRPVRLIAPFPPGGLDASSEQGSRLRDANVRESAAAAVLIAQSSVPSTWSPNRPVRLIVPFPPGGLDASSEQGSLRDANVRESAAAAVLVAQASIPSTWSPNRPVRLIVPFPPGGLDASSEQGSRLRDANVRESAAAAVLIAQASVPSTWSPNRPVRLIVPFPPGGAVDVIGRIVASRLPERLGQQVVVDNRSGANAIIGTEIAARAAPDGHTLLIVPAGHAITPSVMRKLPYDTLDDFATVGLIGNGAYMLVVNPSVPAKTVAEFIALAKARPGQINYAYTGHGNATHLAGELFKVLAGVDIVGIVYKGGGPALTDVIGGQVPAFFSGVASGAAQIKAGKLRALGVTTVRRTAALPDVPTIAEAGVAGYEVDGWYGFLAPKATPAAVIRRLNAELAAVLSLPEIKERLLAAGIDAQSSSPAEFHDRIARDIVRWAAVVKKARIAVE